MSDILSQLDGLYDNFLKAREHFIRHGSLNRLHTSWWMKPQYVLDRLVYYEDDLLPQSRPVDVMSEANRTARLISDLYIASKLYMLGRDQGIDAVMLWKLTNK